MTTQVNDSPANPPAPDVPVAPVPAPVPEPPGLPDRLAALDRVVRAATGRLDQRLLDDAEALLDRAGQRLRLSAEHTVVALAGGTGSGKSSLFNAVCGLELSPTGLRRPMTSKAHACVWGLDGAGPLLDWLDVDKRHRYARASALDVARSDSSLQGLVLLDLPDHDSIQAMHRAEVDRFIGVADLLVWVVDPQKYADAALHRNYIVPFARYASVTLIVLNQIDRLEAAEVDECVADLRRLLEAEGLRNPNIITTSAVTSDGVAGFREVLVDTVAARRARNERLATDVTGLADRFAEYRGAAEPPAGVDEAHREELIQNLTSAAGAPAVAETMESAYELRAADFVGWPAAALVDRLRRDPLRRMKLSELREELRGAFTGPVGAQQGDVDAALAAATDGVTAGLPAPWARAVRAAARSHAHELPEDLGEALKDALPAFNQVPRWWWLVKTWQYFLTLTSVLGVVWIGLLIAYGVLGLGDMDGLLGEAGLIPYVAVLVVCTLGMGWLTSSACRNLVALSSARHGDRMERDMRDRIGGVAEEKVLRPVAAELAAYAAFRNDVDAVRSA
ncbi:50S ribosome-binding GTPase [Actinomadura kijaniata]|uniref:GTP-binding protein EngB required for normal cell division n=1 Tax=Actinomadura namibiensis TaxID=182080 RepID=A0A7W3LMN6_ACTNM|nr:ABC transporter [Actinomadura namibiensis]MBA8950956.1 GTP-binding protein EngB required for normal cell division [Actinomadura namibiensis]